MSTGYGRRAPEIEPLVVRPKDAWRMLGCGNTQGYALINAGALESFLDGRARKVTVESIHRYIERKLASAGSTDAAGIAVTRPRRRGRPRKPPVSGPGNAI